MESERSPVHLAPGVGRRYEMGRINAVFEADGPETVVLAPGGTPHDVENRTRERAAALDFSAPGSFEPHMPGIAEWFRGRDA